MLNPQAINNQTAHTAVDIDTLVNSVFPARSIKRVLLINPPDGHSELFRPQTALRKRYSNYPPYGLGILAALLRKDGITVDILNLNHSILKTITTMDDPSSFCFDKVWQEELDRTILRFKPDLCGITCMFTMTHTSLKRVSVYLEKHAIPQVVGGVHVSNDWNNVLKDLPHVQFALLQEAENSFIQFCRYINKLTDKTNLCQIVINRPEGKLSIANSCRPQDNEIDIEPALDLMNISELSQFGVIGNFHGFKPKQTRFATLLSNRGCRAQCTFCSVRNFNGIKVRQRSVTSVLDELQTLKEKYGISHVVWLDDDLLKDHKRIMELFNGMVSRNLNMTWDATNGVIASSCKDEIVSAMADSGCIAVNIGMESGNPEILRQIRKPGTVKTFLDAAEIFKKYESIHARVFLMIGFPGETLAMINDTINVAREMDLDWCGITTLQPLPNTPIYDSMIEQGLISKSDNDDVRFNAGGFGKQDEIDLGIRLATKNFEEAFCSIPLNSVPTEQQLNDIWFFMNYHLNFHRLFTENKPVKIKQQIMNLSTLSDVISPEHGLALYFQAYLQYKNDGKINRSIIERLQNKLNKSLYWQERMQAFGLSIEDLIDRNFKNKEIPRILPGRLPTESLN